MRNQVMSARRARRMARVRRRVRSRRRAPREVAVGATCEVCGTSRVVPPVGCGLRISAGGG
jgi:hypothetical protein